MAESYAELVGDPVAHSLSPAIHRHWLTALGLAGDYRAVRCPAGGLGDYLASRRSDPAWRGCNVTMPLKAEAAALADRCDETVAATGAANCLVARDGGLIAANTDLDGVEAALGDRDFTGRRAILIGGGGAARAAYAMLTRRGAETTILVRDPERARRAWSAFHPQILALSEGAAELESAAAIINATPLGMAGAPPMPAALLAGLARAKDALAFEMVYRPLETPFLAAARAAGLDCVDGLTMLIGQARRAFELFFGTPPLPGDEAIRMALFRAD